MELFDLLRKVVMEFERLHIPYIVTGSVASMAYGEPRLTNDIDIVAGVNESNIDDLLAAFPSEEFYISEEMIRDAIKHQAQFNIIHPISGLKLDIIIRRDTPFDRSRFDRKRRVHPSESYEADFSSPEDVIIKKMEFYKAGGSEKHLRDIAGILKVSGDEVDFQYITEWSQRLGLMGIWEAVQKRVT